MKPMAPDICTVHVCAVLQYSHQFKCASLSIIVCQMGVLETPSSHSKREQAHKRQKWLTTKGFVAEVKADQWNKRLFFNDSLWEGRYWLTEPQTGHDSILKHTADVFSLCLQFSRPVKWRLLLTAKSKYRKSSISLWVRKTYSKTKEITTKEVKYWPVTLPHRNSVSRKPVKKKKKKVSKKVSKCHTSAAHVNWR